MKEIREKSTEARVSEGSSHRESIVSNLQVARISKINCRLLASEKIDHEYKVQ